jgi:hypothetical protein
MGCGQLSVPLFGVVQRTKRVRQGHLQVCGCGQDRPEKDP